MPSKTKKQARTMRAAAHNKQFAAKMGIPQSVAKGFAKADSKGPPASGNRGRPGPAAAKIRHPEAPASGKTRPGAKR